MVRILSSFVPLSRVSKGILYSLQSKTSGIAYYPPPVKGFYLPIVTLSILIPFVVGLCLFFARTAFLACDVESLPSAFFAVLPTSPEELDRPTFSVISTFPAMGDPDY